MHSCRCWGLICLFKKIGTSWKIQGRNINIRQKRHVWEDVPLIVPPNSATILYSTSITRQNLLVQFSFGFYICCKQQRTAMLFFSTSIDQLYSSSCDTIIVTCAIAKQIFKIRASTCIQYVKSTPHSMLSTYARQLCSALIHAPSFHRKSSPLQLCLSSLENRPGMFYKRLDQL